MQIGPITLTNTVSGVVLGVLLILVGGLAWLANGVYKTRTEARIAKEAAQHAEVNTRNVSNGFAGTVTTKLNTIVEQGQQNAQAIDDVQKELTKHLAWHLEQERSNG